jgi:NAD(P)-dependent dehydrogenase (short-subunit alcohol dehydrogenase family)
MWLRTIVLICITLLGVTESLRAELEPLGIKVTIIEPGYFRTSVLSTTNLKQAQPISDYEPVMDRVKKFHEGYDGKQPGDPKKACERIVDIVTQSGTANGREIPVRVALGTDAYQVIGDMIDKSRSDLEAWKDVTVSTDFA